MTLRTFIFRHFELNVEELVLARTRSEAVGKLDAKTRGDHNSYQLFRVLQR